MDQESFDCNTSINYTNRQLQDIPFLGSKKPPADCSSPKESLNIKSDTRPHPCPQSSILQRSHRSRSSVELSPGAVTLKTDTHFLFEAKKVTRIVEFFLQNELKFACYGIRFTYNEKRKFDLVYERFSQKRDFFIRCVAQVLQDYCPQ